MASRRLGWPEWAAWLLAALVYIVATVFTFAVPTIIIVVTLRWMDVL